MVKMKSDLPETMLGWLHQVKKDINLKVKAFRLDNSGENNAFHKLIQSNKDF